MTLIIKGFLANRVDVLMPEASNVQMRELIEQRRFKDLLDFTETDPSFVSKAINASLKRANGGFRRDERSDGNVARRADGRAVFAASNTSTSSATSAASGSAGHGYGHDPGVRGDARRRW